jgi:hypothetical protein
MTETFSAIASPTRRRRSLDEATAIVGDWQSSCLTKVTFCRERGIQPSVLQSCILRLAKRNGPSPARQDFIEIHAPESHRALTLEIGAGYRVVGLDVPMAVALISALRIVPR